MKKIPQSEYTIGNIVEYKRKIFYISGINSEIRLELSLPNGCREYENVRPGDVGGVSLTDEILVALGFYVFCTGFSLSGYTLSKFQKPVSLGFKITHYTSVYKIKGKQINFLHQVQNNYIFETGEPLDVFLLFKNNVFPMSGKH